MLDVVSLKAVRFMLAFERLSALLMADLYATSAETKGGTERELVMGWLQLHRLPSCMICLYAMQQVICS